MDKLTMNKFVRMAQLLVNRQTSRRKIYLHLRPYIYELHKMGHPHKAIQESLNSAGVDTTYYSSEVARAGKNGTNVSENVLMEFKQILEAVETTPASTKHAAARSRSDDEKKLASTSKSKETSSSAAGKTENDGKEIFLNKMQGYNLQGISE